MDELVRHLSGSTRVLDLGAGGGSFAYDSTQAKVIAADLAFPSRAQPCWRAWDFCFDSCDIIPGSRASQRGDSLTVAR